MPPEAPTVAERVVVQSSSSEDDDHPSCSSRGAEGRRVVNSGHGEIALALDLRPGEWRLGDVEDPAVVHAPVADVASEHHQERLGVGEGVAVPLAGRAVPHVDDVPDADALADVEVEEVVGGESSRAGRAAVDNHLIGLDADCSVRCPGGGRGAGG